MKFLLNILPGLCFIITYYASPENNMIYAAFAGVVSALIAFALNYTLYKTISRMQIIVLVTLLIFSIPTIYFNNPAFLKLKISILNILIAIILLICQFGFKSNIAKLLTGIENPIPNNLWKRITIYTSCYLLACAALNYFIAFYLPTFFDITVEKADNIWVNYKTYGNAIINFIFICYIFNYTFDKLTDTQKAELENLLTSAKEKHLSSKKKDK
jgi:intracellular septation protein